MDTEGFHTHIVDKFVKGSVKEYALTGTPGDRVFRYMEPLKVDAGCIRCHVKQGYNIGEVRNCSEAEVSHGICPECMEKLYGPGGSLTES